MASGKWSETAMLVIDMQNDFILPGAPMNVAGAAAIVPNVIRAVSVARERGIQVIWNDFILPGAPMNVAGAAAIVPNVIRAVSVARERGIQVIWVVREHDPFGRDVELFRRHLYAGGNGPTSKDSKGAELVDGLVRMENEYKLVKTRFSAFFDTHLNSLLQGLGIKSLVVTGVQTPNCIRQTVFDAVASNYQPVTVIVDATAAATPEIHAANIRDMKNIAVATPTLEEWCCSDD